MDWSGLLMGIVWLAVGSVARVLYPYLMAGAKAVQAGQPWPRWEWRYAGQVGVFLLGYVGVLLASDGARVALSSMDAWMIFGDGYGGGDIAREAFKLFTK